MWSDQELARVYQQSAECLKEKIAALKEQWETAPVQHLMSLDDRIRILYTMYLDCLHMAEEMRRRATPHSTLHTPHSKGGDGDWI